jgi:hypothetical protein
MGFLVREADVDAVMDHVPSASASLFDERGGVIRAKEEEERRLVFVVVFSLQMRKWNEEKWEMSGVLQRALLTTARLKNIYLLSKSFSYTKLPQTNKTRKNL